MQIKIQLDNNEKIIKHARRSNHPNLLLVNQIQLFKLLSTTRYSNRQFHFVDDTRNYV